RAVDDVRSGDGGAATDDLAHLAVGAGMAQLEAVAVAFPVRRAVEEDRAAVAAAGARQFAGRQAAVAVPVEAGEMGRHGGGELLAGDLAVAVGVQRTLRADDHDAGMGVGRGRRLLHQDGGQGEEGQHGSAPGGLRPRFDHAAVSPVFQATGICFNAEMTPRPGLVTMAAMQAEAAPRILVVDDDPGIREVLTDYLRQHGYAAEGAATAAEMDRAMAARQPDLIVLDLMMPGEDGLSVCRRLVGKGPPVVMLSAMGEDTDRIIGLELGADDYLAKPCNPRELLARVRAVLRRAEQRGNGSAALGAGCEFAGWRLDLVRREL